MDRIMFIEKLWEEKPELVIKAVKKVWDIREERGDSLKFVQEGNGELRFEKYGHCSFGIVLTDFEVYGCKPNSRYNIEWMKFMHKVFGDKYLYHYIAYRNNKLDKYMAEYEEQYNEETRTVLDKIGFQANKGQTK